MATSSPQSSLLQCHPVNSWKQEAKKGDAPNITHSPVTLRTTNVRSPMEVTVDHKHVSPQVCLIWAVGLNSWREELCLLYSKLLMRHYQEDQSELTVQCLLHGVDAVVLHLGRRLGLWCKLPRTEVCISGCKILFQSWLMICCIIFMQPCLHVLCNFWVLVYGPSCVYIITPLKSGELKVWECSALQSIIVYHLGHLQYKHQWCYCVQVQSYQPSCIQISVFNVFQ